MNLIRKFILFYLISSVFPILTLWFFMYKESRTKLNERYKNLVSSAKVLVKEHINNDLERLEIANKQALLLAIGKDLNKYKTTKDSSDLEFTLNTLQELRHLELVALLDKNKQIIASTDTFEYSSKEALYDLINNSLGGEIVSSIEKVSFQDRSQDNVLYVSVAPLMESQYSNKVIGALLIGEKLSKENFKNLNKVLPSLEVTIQDNCLEKKSSDSYCLPIKNNKEQVITQLRIHIARELEASLREQNRYSLLFYLGLMSLGILLFGLWFHRSIILPINKVAESCDSLSQGEEIKAVQPKHATGEIKNIIQSFNRMVERLSQNEEMQNSFISTLTHDLKTPLIAQNRVYELLEDLQTSNSGTHSRLLDGLKLNNEHLLNMVNTLLETYKFEHGDLKLNLEECNPEQIIEESLKALKVLAEGKNIQLITVNQSINCKMLLDSSQIKRVLINLISNAIENIPPQSQITVSYKFINQKLNIQISDNGPGISESVMPHIFEKYFSHSNTKKKIGSGLGLYICKLIVEKHQGTIIAKANNPMANNIINDASNESNEPHKPPQPNKGCTFIIEIPLLTDSSLSTNQLKS